MFWAKCADAPNVVLHSIALVRRMVSARMRTLASHSSHHLYRSCPRVQSALQTRNFNFTVPKHGDFEAPVRTLDSFEFEDVDFLKMDVEGYERHVLLGAVETLKRERPTMIDRTEAVQRATLWPWRPRRTDLLSAWARRSC